MVPADYIIFFEFDFESIRCFDDLKLTAGWLFFGFMPSKNLKILHLLSQRPDSTGSGIYVQAMLREAANRGHTNFLMAGIASGQMLGEDQPAPPGAKRADDG